MIKYITANLVELALKGEYDVILHGCNCMCNMGKGIAKQIAVAFPNACKADRETKSGDVYKLGSYSYYYDKSLRIKIVNLYTQYDKGPNFEYAAFGLAIRNLVETLDGDEKIAMPMIGAGLGGANWDIVEGIIKEELGTFDVTIIKYDYNKTNQ
jgi:O-acetyl-ADP-ribose deacetylase (regulator of RNase III)